VTSVRDRRRIAASPRQVWKVLGDVERYVQWGRWMRVVRRVDPDRPTGLGAAYDEHSRLLWPLVVVGSRFRIIEFDPPLRQIHRVESTPLTATYDRVFELASDGDGGTWLTVIVEYRPALGAVGRGIDRLALRGVQARRVAGVLDAVERLALEAAG
jgi:hypothetical protein